MPHIVKENRGWVPAFLSDFLESGSVVQTYANGADIALWRSHSGQISAWSNRCPHRGMRLSHGFVRGEMLACIYHGWHYGSDGGCKYIPAHRDLVPPESICATKFQCVEQDGLIWINSGDASDKPDHLGASHAVRTITISMGVGELTSEHFNQALQFKDLSSDHGLVFALQNVGPDTDVEETAIHILSKEPLSASDKKTISRRLDQLRDRVEATMVAA